MNLREKDGNALFVSIPEAAKMFGLGVTTMRKVAVEANALKKIGGRIIRVDVEKMKQYISAECSTT